MLIWFFMRFIFFLYYLKRKEEYNSVHFKLVVTVSFTMRHTFCSLDVRAKFIAKLEYGSTYIYLRTYVVLNENWKELISRVTWFYRIVNEPFWFPWFKWRIHSGYWWLATMVYYIRFDEKSQFISKFLLNETFSKKSLFGMPMLLFHHQP